MNAIRTIRRAVSEALGDRYRAARLLVACSGGPDSSVLLDALFALAPGLRLTLEVVVVDHQLRAGARAEADAVVDGARRLGLEACVVPVVVAKKSMAAARRARYQALLALAQRRGARAIAVGHTASDQAETLLDRLIRGAGIGGLAAMAPRRLVAPGLDLVRPLLQVTRAEVEAYVAAASLAVFRDPTNADPAFRRSRLRHQVLPLLRRERADIDRALALLCERLGRDATHLEAEAGRALAEARLPGGGLDVDRLGRLTAALKPRVLAKAAAVPLSERHLRALERLLERTTGSARLHLPGGLVAERRYGRLDFGPELPEPGDVETPVAGCARYFLLGGVVELSPPAWAAAAAEPGTLLLRNLRPGDRVAIRDGHKKLSDWLIDAKVPRSTRRRVPLLVRRYGGKDDVLWIGEANRPEQTVALLPPAIDQSVSSSLTRQPRVAE